MALIQIRDVPESDLRELKARAADEGRSLNAYVRDLLAREVATPTVAEVLSRAAQRTEQVRASSAELLDEIRHERDAEMESRLGG